MTDAEEYVCTLTTDEAPARAVQIRRLAAGLVSRRRHGREVAVRFAPELAPVVREFVRDESRCCDFFAFDVTAYDDAVELRVRAPVGAEALLDGLYEVFDPGSGGGS